MKNKPFPSIFKRFPLKFNQKAPYSIVLSINSLQTHVLILASIIFNMGCGEKGKLISNENERRTHSHLLQDTWRISGISCGSHDVSLNTSHLPLLSFEDHLSRLRTSDPHCEYSINIQQSLSENGQIIFHTEPISLSNTSLNSEHSDYNACNLSQIQEISYYLNHPSGYEIEYLSGHSNILLSSRSNSLLCFNSQEQGTVNVILFKENASNPSEEIRGTHQANSPSSTTPAETSSQPSIPPAPPIPTGTRPIPPAPPIPAGTRPIPPAPPFPAGRNHPITHSLTPAQNRITVEPAPTPAPNHANLLEEIRNFGGVHGLRRAGPLQHEPRIPSQVIRQIVLPNGQRVDIQPGTNGTALAQQVIQLFNSPELRTIPNNSQLARAEFNRLLQEIYPSPDQQLVRVNASQYFEIRHNDVSEEEFVPSFD